ncbi:MAG: DUF1816 domain-containing protein [Pleurocapsa sp. MO_226.B13]|nr:DUF1816 domain-containing protein [Pleurocapsa sp. MO_226.B13]
MIIFNKSTPLKLPRKFSRIRQPKLLWWIEIQTAKPCFIYYFGPFTSPQKALIYQAGYVEDLVQEKAEVIAIKLKKCHPLKLTIGRESELD